jgi:trimeric autotransporter adhesin
MLKFFTDLASALDALRRHAILFLLGVTIVALALLGRSWLDAHDAAARLQATLSAQQKTITDADQRQTTRDAQLTQTLAQIAAAKEKVQTPAQAATALTQAIPQLIAGEPGGLTLPSPITIQLPTATSAAKSSLAAKSSAQKSGAANSSAQNTNAPSATGDVVAQFGAALASATNSGGGTQNPANGSASANSVTTTNNSDESATSASAKTTASSANSDSTAKSSSATKYPWTALKLELTKLGIGHAAQSAPNQPAAANAAGDSSAAKKDLENREGSTTSQKGSATAQNAPGSPNAQSPASASGNVATQSAPSAQTNSLPQTAANAQGSSSSTSAKINSDAQAGASAQSSSSSTATQTGVAPPAIIQVPQADLKPLYDAVEDCEVCQAKLTAAQGDLSDETKKFAAATAQRDAAISAARGTFWTRTRSAAKWLIIGAAAGAVLARYH